VHCRPHVIAMLGDSGARNKQVQLCRDHDGCALLVPDLYRTMSSRHFI